MALKSIYDIALDLDGTIHHITVKELSKAQTKELIKQSEIHTDEFNKIQNLSVKLVRLNDKYEMFKEAKRIGEALHVMSEIEETENKILSFKNSAKNAVEKLEELYENKLASTVSGQDKDAFLEAVKNSSFSIKEIFKEITEVIQKEKEKKQQDS